MKDVIDCWPRTVRTSRDAILHMQQTLPFPTDTPELRRFAALLEPLAPARFEALAREAALVTRRNFGRAMRLFAPLYLSNECINNCAYCGTFSFSLHAGVFNESTKTFLLRPWR